MKIPFSRISNVAYPFKLNLDNVIFEGFLKKKDSKLVSIQASMKGVVDRLCDSCGKEFELNIDENIEILGSDGIYKDEFHTPSDVMEFFDGQIDLIEFAISELEMYLSDYFYCDECSLNFK